MSINRIKKIEDRYIRDLNVLKDSLSICDYLLSLGQDHPHHCEIWKEEYRIPGCKSVIYCKTSWIDDKLILQLDSDSFLIKGVLAIVEEMYCGASLDEIREFPISFLNYVPKEVIYEEIRTNGLNKCYQQMIKVKN